MNFEQARLNMLTQQIRTWGVLDERVLNVTKITPREIFVPKAYEDLAFADMNIPLMHGQVMLRPAEEARLIQALSIKDTDSILEIGTGSGYTTALLAQLGKHVYTVDIFADFTDQAKQKLTHFGINNVSFITADASRGWEPEAPYDVILITGSMPYLPDTFRNSLKAGGRLVVILGQAPTMEATLITYDGDNKWHEKKLFETVVPSLINAPTIPAFSF